MPDPTQNQNNQVPPAPPAVSPVSQEPNTSMPAHSDLPPLPDFMTSGSTPPSTATTPPTTTNDKPADSSSGPGAPPDLPPMIATPKKKYGSGKIIATILGIFLLVGGLGAGLLLTQQQQIFKQKAATNPPSCASGYSVCQNGGTEACQGGGYVVENYCEDSNGNFKYCVADASHCTGGVKTGGGGAFNCQDYGKNSNGYITSLVKNANGTVTVKWILEYGVQSNDWKLIWGTNYNQIVGNTGNHNTCNGNPLNGCAYVNGGLQAFTTPVLDSNTKYYFKLMAQDPGKNGKNGGPGEDPAWCGNGSIISPPTPTPVPTPTITPGPTPTPVPGATANCSNIKVYSSSWALIAPADLSNLVSGTVVNFCAAATSSSGTIDKAKFTINGVVQAETTTIRPGSTDFCQSYTIPDGISTFNVSAQVHHSTLGWF